ncbi:hypothetical protein G4Y73_10535 [Wenzhouxiangella sp. XN201]|uniref:peptidylprolyl isomerase n=1 Tax=Wenzhouxiangella sp. XN201 TaxID=2710755 RepID=UPI0013CB22C6|nr:peptidylprolyl isomerase [Wenzhouxiangella sp. XN201]NEZ04586.1 hypothetical protein [Wenzhouxiangella sp. XN201]
MIRATMLRSICERSIVVMCVMLLTATAVAQNAERITRELNASHESELFARQGGAEVTQADFDAYLSRIPEEDHHGLLISPDRVGKILTNLMLARMLAEEARQDTEFFEDTDRQARLYQSVVVFLAEEFRAHYLSERMLDDYTQQARELFLTEPNRFRTPETVDFTHILVESGRERGETRAMQRILEVYDRLKDGATLDSLVEEYSDDPEAESNGGQYENVDPAALDDNVAETLAILQPGQISEPVRSEFGWHIVRLDGKKEPQKLEWEKAKAQARQIARSDHRARLIDSLYRRLLDRPLEVAPGALERLMDRYDVDRDDYPSIQEISERISEES